MKKLSMFFRVLLTFLLVFALLFAVQATAMAAGETTTSEIVEALPTARIVIEALLIIAVAVVSFLFKYFKSSSTLKDFVAKLIKDAEIKWLGQKKAGEAKMSWVISKIYEHIPKALRSYFSEDDLRAYVQTVFDEIEAYATIQCDKAVAAIEAKYDAAKAKKPKTTS
jgi:hypothetical protein